MQQSAEEMLKRLKAIQHRIDELMWEYCPEAMTQEQIAEYEAHQKVVDAESKALIEKALKGE